MARPRRPLTDRLRTGGLLAALAALYFAAAKLGLSLAFLAPQVSPVWPPTGIALAAVLLLGPRVWPAIALGAFLANLTVAEPVATAAGIAFGNTLESLAGAWLLRRAGLRIELDRLRDVLSLIGLAALGATALSATIGVASLCLGGVEPWSRFVELWRVWWLGDAMGALVVAPLLLVWAGAGLPRWSGGRAGELAALLAALAAATAIAFGGVILPESPHAALAYAVFPFVVWGALRFGQRGATLVTLLVSIAAIAASVLGRGPFGDGGPHPDLMLAQAYLAIVATTGLFLAAAIAERDRAEALRSAAARDAADRLEAEAAFRKAIEDSVLAGIAAVDLEGRQSYVNPAFARMLGREPEELLGASPPFVYWPPEELGAIRAAFDAALRGEQPPGGFHLRFARRDGERFDALVHLSPLVDAEGHQTAWLASVSDITDQKRVASALEEADRRKDEFLAMLSHELRNPLAPIRNALYVLRARRSLGPEADGLFDILERQVAHLGRLVDDLLDVSRITRGEFALRLERTDLRDVVSRAVESSRPLLESLGHELRAETADGEVVVEADAIRLEQVVTNLLNNAAKYTPRGGHVRVRLEAVDGSATLTVTDDGVGIPGEFLPRVFDLFSQSDRSLDRTQGGLGIGLTLVRRIVELHGGTIEIVSAGRGLGTEVSVCLPRAEAQGEPAAAS